LAWRARPSIQILRYPMRFFASPLIYISSRFPDLMAASCFPLSSQTLEYKYSPLSLAAQSSSVIITSLKHPPIRTPTLKDKQEYFRNDSHHVSIQLCPTVVTIRDHEQLPQSMGPHLQPVPATNRKLLQHDPRATAHPHKQPLRRRPVHDVIARLHLILRRIAIPTALEDPEPQAIHIGARRQREQRLERRAPPRAEPRLAARLPRPQGEAAQGTGTTDRAVAG
jgi:hypothetical protein